MEIYRQLIRQHRRLLILQLLEESNDYKINETILNEMIEIRLSPTPQDVVRSDLQWLDEQGLVEIDILGDLWVPKLAVRGLDAAKGIARVPGVSRPRPK